MQALVCPVCQGRGTVAQDFYNPYSANYTGQRETCRSCWGCGYVVLATEVKVHPEDPTTQLLEGRRLQRLMGGMPPRPGGM